MLLVVICYVSAPTTDRAKLAVYPSIRQRCSPPTQDGIEGCATVCSAWPIATSVIRS